MSNQPNSEKRKDAAHPSADEGASGHPWVHVALATGLLLPLSGAAQLAPGTRAASSSFGVSITIKPQFRVLESRPVNGGNEYRVWTNVRSVQIRGQEYRFDRVGEATIMVPGELMAGELVDQALSQSAQNVSGQRAPDAQTPTGQGS